MKTYPIPLTVWERVSIPDVLPQNAKYEVGIVARDLRNKIRLTQDEIAEIGFKTTDIGDGNYRLQWNEKKAQVKIFNLTQLEFELLRGNLVLKSEKEELPTGENWLSLFEKITNAKSTKGTS